MARGELRQRIRARSKQLLLPGGGGALMTKRDLIDEVARLYPRYSRRDAEVVVNAVFGSMASTLRAGGRIEIRGFGSFIVKQRQGREGRNPRTGRIVSVPAKR